MVPGGLLITNAPARWVEKDEKGWIEKEWGALPRIVIMNNF